MCNRSSSDAVAALKRGFRRNCSTLFKFQRSSGERNGGFSRNKDFISREKCGSERSRPNASLRGRARADLYAAMVWDAKSLCSRSQSTYCRRRGKESDVIGLLNIHSWRERHACSCCFRVESLKLLSRDWATSFPNRLLKVWRRKEERSMEQMVTRLQYKSWCPLSDWAGGGGEGSPLPKSKVASVALNLCEGPG